MPPMPKRQSASMTTYIPNCAVPLVFESKFDEAPYGMARHRILAAVEFELLFLDGQAQSEAW
jgi:hypothetical protein